VFFDLCAANYGSAPTLTRETTALGVVLRLKRARYGRGRFKPDRQGQTVCEVRVWVGRDPVTNAPSQVAWRVQPDLNRAPNPREVASYLEAEATKRPSRPTAGTVGQLFEEYLDHLERVRDLSPQALLPYQPSYRPPAAIVRPRRAKFVVWSR
jgi:hypothetical protein